MPGERKRSKLLTFSFYVFSKVLLNPINETTMIDIDKTLTTTCLRDVPIEEKMSCFVLYGDMSCGKSSTLNHLVVLLTGGGILKKSIQEAFERAFPVKDGRYPDSRHIIHYKRDTDGKDAYIYISTMGDTWVIVEQNFKFFYRFSDGHIDVHQFDGSNFVKCKALNSWRPPCPQFCISPANFHKGAIQAERYFLDNTCLDWKLERWILKDKVNPIGMPVEGYRAGIIKKNHAELAKKIVKEINRIIDGTTI